VAAQRKNSSGTGDVKERQGRTDSYFDAEAAYWRDVYAQEDLQGLVYRERMNSALRWIDALALPQGARVLEVGAGAGLATVEVARRGFEVHSTDSSAGMVALASRHVAEADLEGKAEVTISDVHALPVADASFQAVLALGVLPWLHSPERGLSEISRVLAPGGRVVLSADNRLRLNALVEPVENPLVVPAKYAWYAFKRLRGRRREALAHLHTPRRVDSWLIEAGLSPARRATIGFGPFTAMSRPVLSQRAGIRLHRSIGEIASHRAPRLRRHGWHYLVCARKV